MVPNDQTFIRQQTIAQGREYQVTVKVTKQMHDAFQMLSRELGMTMNQHLRRMLRAYLAQNLIGYED